MSNNNNNNNNKQSSRGAPANPIHKIFGMHPKKGLVYLYTKNFLPPLLYFWIYNPSPNGQMISLIGAQVHN